MLSKLPPLELSTTYKQLPGPQPPAHHENITPPPKQNIPFQSRVFEMMEKSPAYTQKIYDIMRYEQRTHMEAKLLFEHIQDFPFFESFNERNPRNHLETEAFIQLCEKVRYEKHPPRKVLYREGDAPNGKVYLIYSGSVYTATKNPLSYIPENMSCIDINSESIDDLPEDKSVEESPKPRKISDDFSTQQQSFTKPSLFWTRSAKNLFKKNNTENVNSPKETATVPQAQENNVDIEKRKRKSRTSIYVPNSVHALEQGGDHYDRRNESDPSLTKLGQKLTEVQNEMKAQAQGKSPNAGGFANFMKLSQWANKESPENTQRRRRSSVFVDPAQLATLQQIGKMRRGGEGFSPVGSEHGDSLGKQGNNYPTLRQLITDNGWVKSKITRGGFFWRKGVVFKETKTCNDNYSNRV